MSHCLPWAIYCFLITDYCMLSGSDQEFAEVDRFDLVLQSLLHVVAIDDEVSALEAGSLVGDLLHHLLQHPPKADR